MARKLIYFFAAVALVLTILFTVVADVNHGHGPGHHTEESHDDGGHEEAQEEHH